MLLSAGCATSAFLTSISDDLYQMQVVFVFFKVREISRKYSILVGLLCVALLLFGLPHTHAPHVLLLSRMDKDGNVQISWEEWREFLLLQPNTTVPSIFKIWSRATVSDHTE